jgi:hypothetical protein
MAAPGGCTRGCIKTNFWSLHFGKLSIPLAKVLNDLTFKTFTYGEGFAVDTAPNYQKYQI